MPSANLLTGLGIDEHLMRTDVAGARSFLTDALGSTLAIADGMGAVQTEYAYEPFGGFTISGASTTNAFQFVGRENDGTGLMYLRARYYDAARQRFVAQDPLGVAGGANLFAYAANRPVVLIDPFGLKPSPGFGPGGGTTSAGGGSGGGRRGGNPDGNGNKPKPNEEKKPDCPSFGHRWWRNVVNTNNALPGVFTPSGLAGGLRAGETFARTFGVWVETPISVFTAPSAYPGLLVRTGVAGTAYLGVAGAYELGVGTGSAIDAGLFDRCAGS